MPRKNGDGYNAPALEKGLDIIELLASEPDGLTQTQIGNRLGRSVSQLFRALSSLERREYVTRSAHNGRYYLSLRMFELSHRFPPISRLLETALPRMRTLAQEIEQSCHLCVEDNNELTVIAEVQSLAPIALSVRTGTRFALERRTSAYVIAAFQPATGRDELMKVMLPAAASTEKRTALERQLELTRARGYVMQSSERVQGVTDISAPILDNANRAIAALTASILNTVINKDLQQVRDFVCQAANAVSRDLGFCETRSNAVPE